MDVEKQSEHMAVRQLQQLAPFKPVLLWFPHSLAVTTNEKANHRLQGKGAVAVTPHSSDLLPDASLPSGS